MRKKFISLATFFSGAAIAIILIVVAISTITTGFFFARESLSNFYGNAEMGLTKFSDSITMFFNAKEVELNVFAESEQVMAADETIHSFVEEEGTIQILSYPKSPVEENIRKICKAFAEKDKDIAEIYLGTKWGGYATNFDSSMSGGYDPRKRGWYATANEGKGKTMITDAFASTVGATVVGITRCAYDQDKNFVGNASIEVSLDTLTNILESLNFGKDSFTMMFEKDGTVLADTSPAKNNFKEIDEIGIPLLKDFLASDERSGSVMVGGKKYFTQFVLNKKTGYRIVAFSPKATVYSAFHKTLAMIMVISVVLTFVIVLISAIGTKKLMKPLKTIRDGIVERAEQMEAGNADLTQRISVKARNEIGDVADGFNVFSEKLHDIITTMQESKKSLTNAGDLLKNGTQDTAHAIAQITQTIGGVEESVAAQNDSVEQTTNQMRAVIDNIRSLEELVGAQSDVVRNASSAVEEMIGNIGEVNRSVDKMAASFEAIAVEAEEGEKTQTELQTKISEIEEQSKLLNEANSVIANIARQTNLLAMNAAIEAAHAGEAGKGFAVVADEIRKLSETSSGQSKTIGDQLKRIREAISTVVEATQRGVQGYAHLANEIQETDGIVHQIKAAMSEQQEGSTQITQSLHDMNDSASQVQASSQKMAVQSNSIMEQVSALQTKTKDMKLSLSEMTQNTDKIKSTGASLSEISTVMEKSIGEMGRQIDQFKV
ncbi:MAG: methyl-accepting chemotaxis protein [Treponema sp.]|nr:methyl-accepting chemotaxis protein [Treponema sp.]